MAEIEILYEDRDILVCVKPEGMASQPERSSAKDMVSCLKNYMTETGRKKKAGDMRPPYVGVVHRLDKPVGGIMVYGKTAGAAGNLSRQFSGHDTDKTYLAVLTGQPPQKEGILENCLERDGRNNTSSVVTRGGKTAKLSYRVLGENRERTLAEVKLQTGRHHQIRVQMAHIGAGIYGDMKYNRQQTEAWNSRYGPVQGRQKLALFAAGLAFNHPVSGRRMSFKVLPPLAVMTIDEWPGLSYYMNNENEPE